MPVEMHMYAKCDKNIRGDSISLLINRKFMLGIYDDQIKKMPVCRVK